MYITTREKPLKMKGRVNKMKTMTWEEYLEFLKERATTKEELEEVERLKGDEIK